MSAMLVIEQYIRKVEKVENVEKNAKNYLNVLLNSNMHTPNLADE